MKSVELFLLNQLRSIIAGGGIKDVSVDEALLADLLTLSAKQSVTPLVAENLSRQGLLTETGQAETYRHLSFLSFVKWQNQEAEFHKITSLFEKHQIAYMPLKGAVIRQFYPEAWMRTSCDIDILVHEEQLHEAKTALVDELGYREDNKTDHDVMLIAPNGVQFELHYGFTEKQISVAEVWETATRKEESYCYSMSPEWFYLHHLAHMAKHFTLGGCGIRTFIDLWLIKKNMPYNEALLNEMLTNCELSLFAENMLKLVDDWMEGKALSDMQQRIFTFILSGGTYGSLDNRVAVSRSRRKNKFLYYFSRVFPPYESMIYLYPVLRKYGILLPFCHLHRWIHLLNRKKLKKAEAELKSVQELETEFLDETSFLLKNLGL